MSEWRPAVFSAADGRRVHALVGEWLRAWDRRLYWADLLGSADHPPLSVDPEGDARVDAEADAEVSRLRDASVWAFLERHMPSVHGGEPRFVKEMECDTPRRTAALRDLCGAAYAAFHADHFGWDGGRTLRDHWRTLWRAWEAAQGVFEEAEPAAPAARPETPTVKPEAKPAPGKRKRGGQPKDPEGDARRYRDFKASGQKLPEFLRGRGFHGEEAAAVTRAIRRHEEARRRRAGREIAGSR